MKILFGPQASSPFVTPWPLSNSVRVFSFTNVRSDVAWLLASYTKIFALQQVRLIDFQVPLMGHHVLYLVDNKKAHDTIDFLIFTKSITEVRCNRKSNRRHLVLEGDSVGCCSP